MPSYALTYASGGSGWTRRLHLYASRGCQRYTWQTQHGYLSRPADVRQQEFTAYVRIHQILDPANVAPTLKIRGGAHTSRNGNLASCTSAIPIMVFGHVVYSWVCTHLYLYACSRRTSGQS